MSPLEKLLPEPWKPPPDRDGLPESAEPLGPDENPPGPENPPDFPGPNGSPPGPPGPDEKPPLGPSAGPKLSEESCLRAGRCAFGGRRCHSKIEYGSSGQLPRR